MEFRILGPVEAYTGARRLDLGPRMHRLLLAILLAEGRLVTTDQLIDRIWDDDPPVSARDLLHGYASKLRARLNAATGAGPDSVGDVEAGDAAFPDSPVAGQVIGYGVMSLCAGEAHILNVCVRAEFRNLGFGRRLLEHLLERAAASGVAEAFLEVRPSNLSAIRLYQHLGFEQIGIRRGYYQAPDGREDAIVLKRELGKNPAT